MGPAGKLLSNQKSNEQMAARHIHRFWEYWPVPKEPDKIQSVYGYLKMLCVLDTLCDLPTIPWTIEPKTDLGKKIAEMKVSLSPLMVGGW